MHKKWHDKYYGVNHYFAFETTCMTIVLHIHCGITFTSCFIRVRDFPLSALYGTAHCKLP